MMMALGQFVFGMDTLAFQDLDRQAAWRHAANSRVGDRPARQYIGPGDETITLSGTLAPEFRGSSQSLVQLRAMADDGNAYALVDGAGGVYGAFVIEGVTDREYYTNSFHIPVYFPISAAKKIRLEAPYHALTNAGHISYVELDGDTTKNLEAFEKIVRLGWRPIALLVSETLFIALFMLLAVWWQARG